MGIRNKLTKRANELAEGYQDVRDQEFDEQFRDFLLTIEEPENITEEDIQGFLNFFDEHYPDEAEWSWDEANAELDEVGDQQMELARDKEMGI